MKQKSQLMWNERKKERDLAELIPSQFLNDGASWTELQVNK